MQRGSILVVIPAYKEEARIGGVIAGVRQNVPQADILVADDGSPDDSGAHP